MVPPILTFITPIPLGRKNTLRLRTQSTTPDETCGNSPHIFATATPARPTSSPKTGESPAAASPSASRRPHRTTPDLSKIVPYFAYFANMNPNTLGPRSSITMRRCRPLRTTPAELPGHRLVFDVPGLPPEPAWANITADPDTSMHGVLHYLTPMDFSRLTLSEGIAPDDSPLSSLPRLLRMGEVRNVTVVVTDASGSAQRVAAKTFFFLVGDRIPGMLRRTMRPSRRYVLKAIDGADYWQLPPSYIDKVLRKVEYERGPLGGFGLVVPERPHLLDRPDPDMEFGKPSSEMYSPWQRIRATGAVESIERDEEKFVEDSDVRLVHLSNVDANRRKVLRKLYFVPGIDGTGKSVLSQVNGLDEDGEYSLASIVYPFPNRQSLEEVSKSIIDLVMEDADWGPVSFVGESMGGALLIMIVLENIRRKKAGEHALDIDLAMMVNPATCYCRSAPKPFWDFLLTLNLNEAQYAALLPPVLLPFCIDMDSARRELGPSIVPRLRKMLMSLSTVAEVLPQDALAHRMQLLGEFSVSNAQLKQLDGKGGPKDIALISTINDNLLPSLSENFRLQRCIPNLYSMVLPYGGHVPMFDARFCLANFLRPFKSTSRKARVKESRQQSVSSTVLRRRAAMKMRFGRKYTEELAGNSYEDINRVEEWLSEWTAKTSPVFIGEENLPNPIQGKPVLLVSNHTLLGWLDGMYPSQRILATKGVLLRPLTHPSLLKLSEVRLPGSPTVSVADMERFGLVTVSPTALLEQLASGGWTMLFPGGAREALKSVNDDKYSLKWPDSPEFIRSCALFGATIVPVATVGQEDMVDLLLDSNTMSSVIERGGRFFGRPDILEELFSDNARPWKEQREGEKTFMVPPLAFPSREDRLYFRFGSPIEVPEACLDDPIATMNLYQHVKEEVEEGVEMLLRRRSFDTFRSLEKRKEFARAHGENVQAPAGPAWLWTKGSGAYLDEELQPPL